MLCCQGEVDSEGNCHFPQTRVRTWSAESLLILATLVLCACVCVHPLQNTCNLWIYLCLIYWLHPQGCPREWGKCDYCHLFRAPERVTGGSSVCYWCTKGLCTNLEEGQNWVGTFCVGPVVRPIRDCWQVHYSVTDIHKLLFSCYLVWIMYIHNIMTLILCPQSGTKIFNGYIRTYPGSVQITYLPVPSCMHRIHTSCGRREG